MNKIIPAIMLGTLSVLPAAAVVDKNFNYHVDRFADIEVLRYVVPGFNTLSPKQKKLIYFLTEAALSGRDILWDQNGKYNLPVRQLCESILSLIHI